MQRGPGIKKTICFKLTLYHGPFVLDLFIRPSVGCAVSGARRAAASRPQATFVYGSPWVPRGESRTCRGRVAYRSRRCTDSSSVNLKACTIYIYIYIYICTYTYIYIYIYMYIYILSDALRPLLKCSNSISCRNSDDFR